jgi:hypothetical protein
MSVVLGLVGLYHLLLDDKEPLPIPWDEQDQARMEASEWEGMVVANDNH